MIPRGTMRQRVTIKRRVNTSTGYVETTIADNVRANVYSSTRAILGSGRPLQRDPNKRQAQSAGAQAIETTRIILPRTVSPKILDIVETEDGDELVARRVIPRRGPSQRVWYIEVVAW